MTEEGKESHVRKTRNKKVKNARSTGKTKRDTTVKKMTYETRTDACPTNSRNM